MSRNHLRRLAVVAACLAAPSGAARAQSAGCTLEVRGDLPAPVRLDAARLEALPTRDLVAAGGHGADSARYTVVRLVEVLRAAGAPLGPGPQGAGVAQVVIARAADGYRAAYAVAELDSALTTGAVWLALRKDGAPIAAPEGPCRLLVPADRRHARMVRQVTALEFRRFP